MIDALTSAPSVSKQRLAGDPLYVILLGALTMLPPLSIDVILPGLPLIATALQAPGSTIAWTISVFVLAFGSGQLVVGPLSDRLGRRPVLLFGIGAFVATSFACTFVANASLLIVLRFVQGLSACAGTVCARAIVADIAIDGPRAMKLQAYVSATNAIAPIVAPLLGAALLVLWSWRWLFGALGTLGALLFAVVYARIVETAPRSEVDALSAYRIALRRPAVSSSALLGMLLFGGYFAFISNSSLVLQNQLHASRGAFAFAFTINALAAMAGSMVAGKLSTRVRPEALVTMGIALAAIAGCAAFALDTFAASALAFTATMAACALCYGLTIPGIFGIALASSRSDAGATSALLGATQMFGGAVASAIAVTIPLAPSAATAVVAACCALGASIVRAATVGSTLQSASLNLDGN